MTAPYNSHSPYLPNDSRHKAATGSHNEVRNSSLGVTGHANDTRAEDVAKPLTARIRLSSVTMGLPLERRPAEVKRLAVEAFPQTDNWVVVYREILGVEGAVRKLFTTLEEMLFWESTPEFVEVHTMLSALRSHDTGKNEVIEQQRMITVRLPASMHEVLKAESIEREVSINKLCITKLLMAVSPELVPQEPGKRRGRKPGPQAKRSTKIRG